MICGQWGRSGSPDETTPQKKAQMGANQVTGFKSSRQVLRAGTRRPGEGIVSVSFCSAAKTSPRLL
jgi:hypothetical protein